ncbi:MAG: methyltransferase domain-containing protein [Verrucomicrobia bacterium]|nr:methyltransferase domain-containing protein [Verrucomicrobiota bacterium]
MSWIFFRQALANWRATGAIAPSSAKLAHQMIRAAGVETAQCILELGPGTGPFTSQISSAMPAGARYLGLEMNPAFVATLRARFPSLRFETAPAQEFDYAEFLGPEGSFDVIVSGLPWTAFPETLQVAILDQVMPLLRKGGVLVTFAYSGFHLLPNGRRFRSLLRERCSRLETSNTVWPNLPPAFVYSAVK